MSSFSFASSRLNGRPKGSSEVAIRCGDDMNSLQKAILVFVIGASVVVALWAFPRYERWRGNTLTTTDVGYDQMQAVRQAYYNETTRLCFHRRGSHSARLAGWRGLRSNP